MNNSTLVLSRSWSRNCKKKKNCCSMMMNYISRDPCICCTLAVARSMRCIINHKSMQREKFQSLWLRWNLQMQMVQNHTSAGDLHLHISRDPGICCTPNVARSVRCITNRKNPAHETYQIAGFDEIYRCRWFETIPHCQPEICISTFLETQASVAPQT